MSPRFNSAFHAFASRRLVLCTAVLLTFSACAPADERDAIKPPQAKALRYDSKDFVTHLSLARIALGAPGAGDASAKASIAVLQRYAAQRHKPAGKDKEKIYQPVFIVDYEIDAQDAPLHVLAPLDAPYVSSRFPELRDILEALGDSAPYTLHNVRVGVAIVNPPPLKALEKAEKAEKIRTLDTEQQRLIATIASPLPLEQARAQLQLTRFFIDARIRDGAYLALENAKQALATATNAPAKSEELEALGKQMEELEVELPKAMPFTL